MWAEMKAGSSFLVHNSSQVSSVCHHLMVASELPVMLVSHWCIQPGRDVVCSTCIWFAVAFVINYVTAMLLVFHNLALRSDIFFPFILIYRWFTGDWFAVVVLTCFNTLYVFTIMNKCCFLRNNKDFFTFKVYELLLIPILPSCCKPNI